jgi:hypothetical protein
MAYLIALDVRLIRIVPFNIHHDELLAVVAAQDDPARRSMPGLSPQHRKLGPEEMVEERAFARILGSDDGDSVVLLAAVPEGGDERGERLLAG